MNLHTAELRDPRPVLESAIQSAICQLLAFKARPNLIWFAVPNGIPASARTGAKFVKLGMRAGVADLCFVLMDGRCAFMEVKTGYGRLTKEQKQFQTDCEAIDVPYVVVRSSREAETVLASWNALRSRVFSPPRMAA